MAKKKRTPDAFVTRRLWAGVLVVSLLVIASWSASPISARIQQEKELTALSSQLDEARADNGLLRKEIKQLEGDPEHWEMLVRRDLRYVKSDELAYVVVEQDAPVEDVAVTPVKPTLWEQVKTQVKELSVLF